MADCIRDMRQQIAGDVFTRTAVQTGQAFHRRIQSMCPHAEFISNRIVNIRNNQANVFLFRHGAFPP